MQACPWTGAIRRAVGDADVELHASPCMLMSARHVHSCPVWTGVSHRSEERNDELHRLGAHHEPALRGVRVHEYMRTCARACTVALAYGRAWPNGSRALAMRAARSKYISKIELKIDPKTDPK